MPSILDVPPAEQERKYSCGAACVLAVLRSWLDEKAAPERESELYGSLRVSPSVGTEAARMVTTAREWGLNAYMAHTDYEALRGHLKRGVAPIIQLQAWNRSEDLPDYSADWDNGHYVVVVGEFQDGMVLMDPVTGEDGYCWLTREELEERWHGWENGRRVWRSAVIISNGDRMLGSRTIPRVEPLP